MCETYTRAFTKVIMKNAGTINKRVYSQEFRTETLPVTIGRVFVRSAS